jgi:hypothetical protein
MKIISLFTKAPQHQRFNYKPRYYDPTKEEMQERVQRIQQEIDRERGLKTETQEGYRSRIAGSFQAARKRSKPTQEKQSMLMRFGIVLFMVLFLFAFLQWGKPALYGAFVFVPFYLYFKFKEAKRK